MVFRKRIEREGQKFGRLTLISYVRSKKYLCECECGNKKIVRSQSLLNGHTKSCGCIRSLIRPSYDDEMRIKLKDSIEITSSGCWEWKKSKHKQGYGNFPYKRKCLLAHRVAWMLFNGELNEDILVLHKCDNPPCCNPEHLFLGTDYDNVKDSIFKGRFTRTRGETHFFSKLTDCEVAEIKKLHAAGIKQKDIANKFSIVRQTVRNIVTGRARK